MRVDSGLKVTVIGELTVLMDTLRHVLHGLRMTVPKVMTVNLHTKMLDSQIQRRRKDPSAKPTAKGATKKAAAKKGANKGSAQVCISRNQSASGDACPTSSQDVSRPITTGVLYTASAQSILRTIAEPPKLVRSVWFEVTTEEG